MEFRREGETEIKMEYNRDNRGKKMAKVGDKENEGIDAR